MMIASAIEFLLWWNGAFFAIARSTAFKRAPSDGSMISETLHQLLNTVECIDGLGPDEEESCGSRHLGRPSTEVEVFPSRRRPCFRASLTRRNEADKLLLLSLSHALLNCF